MMPAQILVVIDHPSSVAEARRHANSLAVLLGFDSVASGKLAIAVTEVASNIVKHASRGKVTFRALQDIASTGKRSTGVEVLALDKGPGIANIARSLRDGHSTAGSLAVRAWSITVKDP